MRERSLAGIGLSSRAATGIVGVVAGLLVAASAPPASAVTTDQSYWVPVDKRIVVRGHGYGHGHGMSQYGAYGAALQGRSHKEILDFYYPGTTWSTVRGQVRVLITADTTTDVEVSPAAGLFVRDRGDGTKHELPAIAGVKRWRLAVEGGKTVLEYLTDKWRRHKPGDKETLVGDGEFKAKAPITLWTPSGPRAYRGALRAATPSPGSAERDTVNVLSMDAYVKGVIPSEMPASWHPEAVKSQAVAARTYASWSRAQNAKRYYQICDTTSCQVYGGVSREDSRSNAAVDATKRQILTYAGKPAFTQFSASSGGWTSKGSVPYLPAQADPYDGHARNPVHNWEITVDASRLEKSFPAIGTLRRIRVTSRDGNGDWSGRVWNIQLDGSKADRTMTGDSFRWMFGLRSSWFTIDSAQYMARELSGPILAAYEAAGGADGRLGQPTTGIQKRLTGVRAKFEGGVIFSNERTGTVPVMGKIATRYLRVGGLRSGLGWPTRGNYAIKRGERVDFQNGYIKWIATTDRTRMRITG